MKSSTYLAFCLICLHSPFASNTWTADAVSKQVPTTEIIKMLESKIEEEVIITKVRKAHSPVDLSADEMIALKKAGATPALLKVILDPDSLTAGTPRSKSDESDDGFYMFDGNKKTRLQLAAVELNTKMGLTALVTGSVHGYMVLSKSGPSAETRTTNSIPQFGELAVPTTSSRST